MTTQRTPITLDAEERAWLNYDAHDVPREAWHKAWQLGEASARAEDAPLLEAVGRFIARAEEMHDGDEWLFYALDDLKAAYEKGGQQ